MCILSISLFSMYNHYFFTAAFTIHAANLLKQKLKFSPDSKFDIFDIYSFSNSGAPHIIILVTKIESAFIFLTNSNLLTDIYLAKFRCFSLNIQL